MGDNTGSSYPTALDTDTTKEVASPNAGKTKITAARANDVGAAIVNTQAEVGIRGVATQNIRDTINTEHQATGAHTTAAPVNVTKAAASAGTGTTVSRADHKHDVTTAVPANVTKAAAAEGTATSLARSDHKHDITTANVSDTGTANAEGTATSLARSDHTHNTVVVQANIGASAVGTPQLKTATGVTSSASSIDLTMNDFSFFPSITITAGGIQANWTVVPLVSADPGNTVGRLRIHEDVNQSRPVTVRWRYITASDDPTVWVSFDATGKILATWMSDDPTPDGSPGVIAYDVTGKIAQKSILIPRADLGKLITGIPTAKITAGKKKSTTPDKEPFRIMWEAFKNPADEVIKRAKIVGGKLEAR